MRTLKFDMSDCSINYILRKTPLIIRIDPLDDEGEVVSVGLGWVQFDYLWVVALLEDFLTQTIIHIVNHIHHEILVVIRYTELDTVLPLIHVEPLPVGLELDKELSGGRKIKYFFIRNKFSVFLTIM